MSPRFFMGTLLAILALGGCTLGADNPQDDVACEFKDLPAQPDCPTGYYLILCSAPRPNPDATACVLPFGNDRGDLWCCK